jgi:hypothetical protein
MSTNAKQERNDLLWEWTDNEQKLKQARALAKIIAEVLSDTARVLQMEPETLVFSSGDRAPRRFQNSKVITESFALDMTVICETRDRIRELLDKQRLLNPQVGR